MKWNRRVFVWLLEKNYLIFERRNASSEELGSTTDIDLDSFPSLVDSAVNNSGMLSVEPAAPLESNTKSELFGCPKSDVPSKKLDREPQFQLLEWDSINMNRRSSSSTYQNTKWTVVHVLQRSWDHQQSLNIPFSSFKNLDDSHNPVGSSPGRDSRLPLLEWHSVEVNERSLSATCPNSNWTLIPAVQSSWNHQRDQNNWCESFGTLGLCSSPVIRNYPRYFYALVSPASTSYDKHEFGRLILETGRIIADLQYLPLTLSHSTNCLILIADCNHYETACQGSETSSSLPSSENHPGFMRNALVEENQTPGFGNHEDESDSSLGGSHDLINCNEDMLDIHDQRSFDFQISRDKGINAMVKTCSNHMAILICRRKRGSQTTVRENSESWTLTVDCPGYILRFCSPGIEMNGIQQRKGVEMNAIQQRKGQDIEKFPGCLGRMVNLFDLNSSVPGNRLLTDKPHRDGPSHSRSQSDVVRMLSPTFGDPIEDKVMVSELRRTLSSKKGNATPMKMLLAQEMSKDVESKRNPPNVVAKLMGLDALPRQQHNSSPQRCRFKGSSRHSLCRSEIPVGSWEQDQSFPDEQMQCEASPCEVPNKYKDVYEIWQQSPRTTYSRDSTPQKGSYIDNVNENKMALVRQKFMEAKHLVTDEKLRQTKEFQDALEVLSSNRDLFLKCLDEPNSTFSQHLNNFRSLSLPPQTKRITVLRPSKMVDKEKLAGTGDKADKQTKKPVQTDQVIGWAQPWKTQDIIRTPASPSPPSPRILLGGDLCEELEEDDAEESKEVATKITRQMRENMMGHRRDETLLSSVFSNGYTGDDSSCNRSENEYAVENLSDSEVMSPTSRHSWDYINRFASPYSSSPFSRASCSPESSVCREAKKRLSERWAMMTSNRTSQEQRHGRRSSSTLGEMLALSDTKKLVRSEEEGSSKEQEARGSTSCIASNLYKEESTSDSPKNILRSKSVPGSSTMYFSDPEASKEQVPKELMKAKSMKSSLKEKVSSLFFSKNKKTNKEKYCGSQYTDESPSVTPGAPGSPLIHHRNISNDASQCANDNHIQECLSPVLGGSESKTPLPDLIGTGQKQGMIAVEGGLSVAKPSMSFHISENQEQPSPISVLEPPFEEDENTVSESSGGIKPVHRGVGVPPRSNLIDKSPPIESIARTLSWNDSCSETATLLYPSKLSSVSPGTNEEERDWFLFVQLLLSAAGLNGEEVQFDSFISRWHSPESPLDPCLRDKYDNLNDKEPLHEAKRRQWKSNRKLVFDCVNAALLELTGSGSDSSMRAIMSFGRAQTTAKEGASPMLVDHVWAQMEEWFSGKVKCLVGDDGDIDSLVVEKVVRKEVGKGWADNMKLETGNLGREIEWRLVEELVEEAVIDLSGPWFFLNLVTTIVIMVSPTPLAEARAFFIFADSLVDNGNNNYLATTARADSPPYGIDYPSHKPTGHFSNGLNLPDIISMLYIFTSFPFICEVCMNFRCIDTGILNDTGIQFVNIIRIFRQFEYFQEYQTKLTNILGQEQAQRLVNQALVLITLGGNDFVNNYFLVPLSARSRQFSIPDYCRDYCRYLISEYRKILLHRTLRLRPGRVSHAESNGECVPEIQQAANIFNPLLVQLIQQLNSQLGSNVFLSANAFSMNMDFISNPQRFGFVTSKVACCGQGPYNGLGSCTKLSNVCPNRDVYVFWDSFHPTERANRLIVRQFMIGSTEYMNPMNLSTIIAMDSTT
ncbi:hypothetical protein V6N12_016801 [Hibiscus sabdariffa]|uniref:GDSL esterase/lipase n=1 Tax=Hibiscus sabdariffa TaxID=183260 RepID=A0ABR2CER6_9ROSI